MADVREKLKGIMVPLGHDKSVLSDIIVAVEPLDNLIIFNTDRNGNKLRSRVLINHAADEILATRTARTILKSMTRQVGKVLEDGREVWKWGEDSTTTVEKQMVIYALVHHSTVKDAIESLPFGETKYYQLVKQHGIDVKSYLESTDDPEMYHDQRKDEGLV